MTTEAPDVPGGPAAQGGAGGGLRSRKRLAAMHRVQAVAMDLFDERGFDAVTVEQVAEAAEISASSVYRYFGTKEQILLWDDVDLLVDLPRPQAPGEAPLAALREAIGSLTAGLDGGDQDLVQRRVRLIMTNPSVEAESNRRIQTMSEAVGDVIAARLGRSADDLEVQVFGHAVVGGLVGALHHWYASGFDGRLHDVMALCFDLLEQGLQVGQGPARAEPGEG